MPPWNRRDQGITYPNYMAEGFEHHKAQSFNQGLYRQEGLLTPNPICFQTASNTGSLSGTSMLTRQVPAAALFPPYNQESVTPHTWTRDKKQTQQLGGRSSWAERSRALPWVTISGKAERTPEPVYLRALCSSVLNFFMCRTVCGGGRVVIYGLVPRVGVRVR